MGSSKPWPDAMEVLTGDRNMDASGLMEYFKPLYDWLKAENERTGEYIGWESSSVGKNMKLYKNVQPSLKVFNKYNYVGTLKHFTHSGSSGSEFTDSTSNTYKYELLERLITITTLM